MEHPAIRYGLTLAAVAVALAARWLLDPLLGDHVPFATFFVAVAAAAWLGGLRPALLATVLGFLLSLYFFVPPRYSVVGTSGPHLVGLAMYFMCGLAIAGFGEAMRVAQRRHAEQKERLRTTLASIGDAVITTDAECRITNMNAAATLLTGWTNAEAVGVPLTQVFNIVNESTRQPVENPAFRALKEGVIVGLANHTVLIAKDGTERPIDDSAAPIRCKAGAVVGCVLVFRDITDRHWAEEALRQREERFRRTLNEVSVPTLLHADDDEILLVNKAWTEITGYRIEDIPTIGDWTQRAYGERHATVKEYIDKLFEADERLDNGEWVVATATGEKRVWHFFSTPVSREPGGRRLLVSNAIDVTDRKRAEAAQLDAQLQIATTLESITDGFIRYDRDWRIVYVNAEAERINKLSRSEMLGQIVWELFPAVVGTNLEAEFRRAVAEPVTVEFENHYEPFGRWYSLKCYPTPDGGLTTFIRDITDQKLAADELRRSEARLRRVFESNVVAMIRWDLDRSLILDANAEFLRMTGYTRDDVASGRLNFRDLTPAEWTARNEQGIRTIRADGHAAPYEKEYFRKDGSRVPLIIAGTRFEDSPSEGMSFLIDISEAKRAEADLRVSEQRLRLVVESATGYAIFTMNTEGIIDGWNAGAERLFGYPEGEVVGQHDRFLYTPEDAAQKIPEREMKKAAGEGRAVNERWHVRKGGDRFWGSGLVQPLRDGESVVGFLKIMRDMTEQRKYEERLRQAEEQFRTLADNMSQFAWTADEKGWIFWYNRRWYEYTGTTLEEMQGWGWKAVHHPDHVDRVVKRIQHSWDTGELWEDTFPLRGIDGNYRWFLSRAVPIRDDEGRILRWFGTNTDITKQRELQHALQESDRRKDEFLATLAHELRNPLAPIRNGLQLMRLAGDNYEVAEQARNMMDRQLGQMVRLVDDLMDVSRITRGKLELKRERVQLAAVVNSAVETSRPLIEQMGHELILTLPKQPIVVDADLTRLAQVFLNLLNNAAKYSDRGSHIRLTAERQGSDVVVTVKDNGIGIAADQLPHIFEMFTQVDRSLEKAQGGLGIGLTLVRRLVEMHDGRVEAHSGGPGKGSEFIVRLPVVVEASVPPKAHEQHQGDMKSTLRILIVDDNRDSADSLAMMLKVMGNDTRTAYDGEEAVAVANEFRPAVILLDIGLPKINGYEACRRIRAQTGGEKLVIIAQTGWGQDEDRQRTHEAGFDHHLVKPVDPTALMKMLAGLSDAVKK